MLTVGADDILHQQENRGAESWSDQGAGSSKHCHDEDIAGCGPVDRIRGDKTVEYGVEPAGQSGETAGDRKREKLISARPVADRCHPLFVFSKTDERLTKRRIEETAQAPIGECKE